MKRLLCESTSVLYRKLFCHAPLLSILTALSLSWAVLLTGCSSGEKEELESYYETMDSFLEKVRQETLSLEELDPSDPQAAETAVGILDEMKQSFSEAASADTPEEYVNVQEMIEQADDYLEGASGHFHDALAENPMNGDLYETGVKYYEKAMERIDYAITFLHGEVPEGVEMSE